LPGSAAAKGGGFLGGWTHPIQRETCVAAIIQMKTIAKNSTSFFS
jgi:hypothetical protein